MNGIQIKKAYWKDDKMYGVPVTDPYAELKDAYESGCIIQKNPFTISNKPKSEWRNDHFPQWDLPVECYRVQPKTKKMYQWLFKHPNQSYHNSAMYYEEGETPTVATGVQVIKRLDNTMVEID